MPNPPPLVDLLSSRLDIEALQISYWQGYYEGRDRFKPSQEVIEAIEALRALVLVVVAVGPKTSDAGHYLDQVRIVREYLDNLNQPERKLDARQIHHSQWRSGERITE